MNVIFLSEPFSSFIHEFATPVNFNFYILYFENVKRRLSDVMNHDTCSSMTFLLIRDVKYSYMHFNKYIC